MGKRVAVSYVLRGIFRRPRQRLAISVHGVRERRRRLPDSLRSGPLHYRQAFLLYGDDSGTVHQPVLRTDMVRLARVPRYFLKGKERNEEKKEEKKNNERRRIVKSCFPRSRLNFSPGLGYGMAVSVFSVITYYCALMALTLFYMVASFQSTLPWAFCWPEWGDGCFDSNSSDGGVKNGSRSSADFYFR